MKKSSKLLFFAIGLIGVIALVFTSDFRNVDWSIFLSGRFVQLLIILLVLWGLIYTVHTHVYRLILGEEKKTIGFFGMYGICISGLALNNVTPAGVLGGEPYRILELKKYVGPEKAVSTAFTFTMLYVAAHFLLWFTESVVFVALGCPSDTLFMTVFIILVGVLTFTGVCFFLFGYNYKFVEKVVKLFSHLPFAGKKIRAFYDSKKEKIETIDRQIGEFRKEPVKMVLSLLVEYFARILEGIEYFLIFRFLGIKISLIEGIVIMANASLMGNLFFFIPMQIGSRESGMKIALSWFAGSTPAIIPAYIIYRLRDILCTLIGVFCILISKQKEQPKNK